MPNYRRKFEPGGTFFFTLVSASRQPRLTTEVGRKSLRTALKQVQQELPFIIDAIVLLPDHLHAIFTLPPGDSNYSQRWSRIKELTTRRYLAASGTESSCSQSHLKKRERGVWQRRFWEHMVRDADDFKRCLDYVHWNPVKHRLVERVQDYEYSTFHRYVTTGEYDINWATGAVNDIPGAEWE